MDKPKDRSFWISFRVHVGPQAIVEGDLTASTPILNAQFLLDVKAQITAGMVRQNGGVVIPNMGEPILLMVLELED